MGQKHPSPLVLSQPFPKASLKDITRGVRGGTDPGLARVVSAGRAWVEGPQVEGRAQVARGNRGVRAPCPAPSVGSYSRFLCRSLHGCLGGWPGCPHPLTQARDLT